MARERLHDVSEEELRALFGPLDRNLRQLRERYGVRVTLRHDVLLLEGQDTRVVTEVTRRAKQVLERLRRGEDLAEERVSDLLLEPGADAEAEGAGGRGPRHVPGSGAPMSGFPGQGGRFAPTVSSSGLRPGGPGRLPPGRGAAGGGGDIRPKTPNQERYVRAIRHHDVVFSVGPAGTGKTFLAVVEADRKSTRLNSSHSS